MIQGKNGLVVDRVKQPTYWDIVAHYTQCLAQHGDTPQGMDWPNAEDANLRYQVMLDVIRHGSHPTQTAVSLLDFGCGASHLYGYLQEHPMAWPIEYTGLDLSEAMITLSRQKYPHNDYFCLDLLQPNLTLPRQYDYAILNGVFTEKRELSQEAMLIYWEQLLTRVFELCTLGLAFNVMSTQVDWQRDDLFHVPMDAMATFLRQKLSRHFVIRHDYGLYEYTVYLYKTPNRGFA